MRTFTGRRWVGYGVIVSDPTEEPESVVRLSPGRLGVRLAAVALAVSALTASQIVDTDDYFPLGSLSQYGAPKNPNGSVRSVYVEASYPGETQPRLLGLSHRSTGVARGEIEGQLGRFVDDPALLQSIAEAHRRLRPDLPQPEVLYLRRSTQQLRDGRAVGEPTVRTLAEWQVQ